MTSPLHDMQVRADASFMPFGPGESIQMVETFGEYELEYAAVRKGVGILENPQRGLVEVKGADRLEFLHRMITNDTRSLKATDGGGEARRAFLLNKAGRITADMIVLQQEHRTLLALDRFDAAALVEELNKFLFTEDVILTDLNDEYVHLSLHGPQGAALLRAAGAEMPDELAPLTHAVVTCAGVQCVAYRFDQTGSPGLHLLVPTDVAVVVYRALADAIGGLVPPTEGGNQRPIRGRGIGWLAFNTARIEAGTPLFHVDFGPDTLPHETALIEQTVSFTKGCYLGQEIVARMHNLGHPKRVLVGLRFEDDRMPVAGTQVFTPASATAQAPAGDATHLAPTGAIIGAITSSTISPMLSQTAIALGMIKWGQHRPGTKVSVPAEGAMVSATVQGLKFL